MKLIYVITQSDSIGGASLHVRDLAAAMQGRGHDVHVLVGGTNGPFIQMLRDASLAATVMPNLVRPIAPLKDLKCVRDLKNQIRHHAPDLVHCHSSKAGVLGRYASHRCGKPVVFSAHGWSFAEGIPGKSAAIYRVIERQAATWCDKILCGCERDRQLGLRERIGNAEKLQTIWYGIDDLDEACSADPAVSPPNLVMVARFEQQKDHATLISALGRLKDLPWTIDLVGDGSRLPAIRAQASQLGIADRIHFAGAQPTGEYLLRSQIFLLISNWEGMPLSTLEAMRVGLPLIASDVGGVPEQITDGDSGFVIPRGDVDLLAQRLRILIGDPELRVKMGKSAKSRFQTDFRYDRMLDQVEDVYRSLQASRPSAQLGSSSNR